MMMGTQRSANPEAPVLTMPERRSEWQVPSFTLDLWRARRGNVCVVVPVINEGARIRSLTKRMSSLGLLERFDVMLVDGGSLDGSLDRGIHEPLGIRGVVHKTGPGKLSAQLRCGYAVALEEGYEHIVTIDGNDKDDPAAIPAFVAALESGADFVQASRFLPGGVAENTPMVRDLAIRLVHAPMLSWASGFHWTDTTQGFRAYSRRLLADPRVGVFRDVFEKYELLAYLSYRAPRLGYRCVELPSARRYPAQGEIPTKITAFRGNWQLLVTLARACLGRYDPPTSRSRQANGGGAVQGAVPSTAQARCASEGRRLP